jgi:DNA-binding transcriptional regulator YdaS (Cro superfamily)
MKLAEYLEKYRLTHAEFGERVGIKQPQVSRIINHKGNPSPHLMNLIEEATKGEVTMQDLFNRNAPSRLKKRKPMGTKK